MAPPLASQDDPLSRATFIRLVPGDAQACCQLCDGGGRGYSLVVLEPIIDHSNGQRITVAICPACARALARKASEALPQPRRRTVP